ncbi:MAG TPA: nucleotidyltransferase family protein [Verrucomicrobiae bacterium]|nr:nucleotidyltransferase family protein [Verrucomicrobiae bacterium]
MISAVVLAAGGAQSLGQEKLLLPLRGKPVLQWVLESALASDLDEIVCVTRELASVRRQLNLSDERLFWLTNYAADRGQSTSVISGLWATNPKSEGVMFLVGDQPLIRKELINSLIEKFRTGSAWIVAPSFNREPRNPVLFRRNLFSELLQLSGDRGGRVLIEKHRNKTALVEWKDETPFLDIDGHEDYERLKEMAYADD